MRRHDEQNPIRPSEKAIRLRRSDFDRPAEAGSRLMLTALALLSLVLMFASRAALAEPNEIALNQNRSSVPAALSPMLDDEEALFGSRSFPEASPELTAPPSPSLIEPAADHVPTADEAPRHDLEALLSVRATPAARSPRDTDATIAAAVAEGSRPDLEPKKPFRKKNFDLFRTEHEVQILRNDMLLRLRLRAKSRETMSVELRF